MKLNRKRVFKWIRGILVVGGSFFFILLILAFTTLPYHIRHWMGTHEGCTSSAPAYIVLLGGAGIPSEDGLIRSYYTALLAKHFPSASVIIAIPGDIRDSLSSPCMIREELILRGIDKNRIRFENTGHNTRQQAITVAALYSQGERKQSWSLVTSPEHMYRSVLAFRKAGFVNVSGYPTFETSIRESDLYFKDADLKGNRIAPPIGDSKQVRYQFWNHLRYEILVMREGAALAYYKLRAWI